jgi:predicted RNA-binding Zn ribbon-like protein
MRFEFVSGALCLDYANTIHNFRAHEGEDDLHSISDLLLWAHEAGLLSSAEHDRLAAQCGRSSREGAAALKKAIAIRDLLLSIFVGIANGQTISRQQLSDLNSALAEAPGMLQVRRSSGQLQTEWKGTADGFERVLFAVLRSAAELLANERLQRVRECAAANCTWLFVDESRNHSRRWCDMRACGNRMKARRHYKRMKAAR